MIFERREVLTQTGSVYGVFTPYKNAWLKKITPFYLKSYPVERHAGALADRPEGLRRSPPDLTAIGFQASNLNNLRLPVGLQGARALLDDFRPRLEAYQRTRDFPAL